jgi:hypothetical protein
MADWYRSFAAIRYGGNTDAETVQGLEEALVRLAGEAEQPAGTQST